MLFQKSKFLTAIRTQVHFWFNHEKCCNTNSFSLYIASTVDIIDAEIYEGTPTLCSDDAFMLSLNKYRITVRQCLPDVLIK